MALYKDARYLTQTNSVEFDKTYKPGESALHPGIYRCDGCGKEITHNVGDPLPPQNHHQHKPSDGNIVWRMIVWG